VPDWGSIVSTISPFTSGVFLTLIVIGLVGAGMLIGGLFVAFIIRKLLAAVKSVLGGRKGGRRGRR
jgi:hypothetical protein